MKRALISGITGHVFVQRPSTFNTDRLDSIYLDPREPNATLHLHYGDVTDGASLRAAQSHVGASFDQTGAL